MINKYEPKYKKSKSKDKFDKIKKEIKDKFEQEHTFTPNINYNFHSTKEKNNEKQNEFYNRLSAPKTIEFNKRQKEKEHEEHKKFQSECTFQPNINNNNLDSNHLRNSQTSMKSDSKKVSDRLYKLADQLKEKREKQKREYQDYMLQGITFAPVINESSKQMLQKYDSKPLHERVKLKNL